MKNLKPITREEKYLHAIATGEAADITPVTGEEHFLAAIASGETLNREPKTRKEYFLNECANGTGGSGGGGLKTAQVTIVSDDDEEGAMVLGVYIPIVDAFDDKTVILSLNEAAVGETYTVPLAEDGAWLIIADGSDYTNTYSIVSGSATDDGSGDVIVTGDCTIKVNTTLTQ